MLNQIFFATAIFVGFYLLSQGVERIIRHMGERDVDRADLFSLIARVTQIGLIMFGVVSALGTVGVDVSAMVAGLGLTGFALGFALKDALSNIMAGIMLIAYQPFKRGDELEVDGVTGIVNSLDLRYTTIEDDDEYHLIPNSKMLSNTIRLKKKEQIEAEEKPAKSKKTAGPKKKAAAKK